jgi:hypothetical protein
VSDGATEPAGGRAPELTAQSMAQLTAQWALWGRRSADTASRVLASSDGTLKPRDFREVVERYASGAHNGLPQYTLFWIPGSESSSGESSTVQSSRAQSNGAFVGLAIHEHARYARSDVRDRYDAAGREIVYTRLFCLRYQDVAEQRATFTGLLSAAESQQLPPPDPAGPVTLRLDPDWQVPAALGAAGELAATVAVLLLTTRPVCVLGADDVPALDRLAFIDEVLACLPYGVRASLSAATWASPTAHNLRLRLFFAGAERADGGVTTHVTWGQSARPDLSAAEHEPLRHYADWLERSGAEAAVRLGNQTDPVRFNADELRQAVASLPADRPIAGLTPRPRPGHPRDTEALGKLIKGIVRRMQNGGG